MSHTYKSIVLVDLSYLIARHYHARANDSGPNDAGESVLGALARLRESVDHVVLCVDSPPYDRKKLYPEYKGTRKAPDPALIQISQWVRARVDADGYNVAAYLGQEGDDLVATLARLYSAWCPDIRIVSSDKDIAQCVREGVRMIVPGKGGHPQMLDVAGVVQRFGVVPEYMPLFLALMGDKGDNIPGVDKVGEKKAAEMANAAFGDRVKLGVHAVKRYEDLGAKAPVWLGNVVKALGELPLWLELTTLRTDVPVDAEKLLVKRAPAPLVEEEPFPLGPDELGELDAELDEMISRPPARTATNFEPTELVVVPGTGIDAGADAALNAIGIPARLPKPPTWDEYNAKLDAKAEQPAPPKSTFVSPTVATGAAPKAEPAPVAGAPAATTATPATVVERTEGPPKPRKQDEIESVPLALRPEAPSWSLALQPSSAKEALQIASVLFNSRFYSQYGSHRGIFAVISLGRELEMGYAEALEAFHIVKDKPFPKAKWILARCQKHRDFEWFLVASSTDQKAVIKAKHKRLADVLVFEYTIEEAAQQGHTTGPNRTNWEKSPRSMLRARAITGAASEWCPGAAYAMPSAEEAEDFE